MTQTRMNRHLTNLITKSSKDNVKFTKISIDNFKRFNLAKQL
jgi:hypothetical protein